MLRLPAGWAHASSYRSVPPEETVARLRPLLPVLGITRVANVTGLDVVGVPVVMVCRPNSRSLAVFQGKGVDLASAQASGVMEAVEHYHAERILSPLKLASFQELRFTHALVDVESLPRASARDFHPHLRLLWIEGHELLSGTPVWLPFELVHTNYTLPFPPGSGTFLPSSNGLASGNHWMEALSHGLCEVVERDAVTLWFLSSAERRERSQLALETVADPECRQVLARFAEAGLEVAAWEVTSDVGIPVFLCALLEPVDSLRRVGSVLGMGCHPAREVALRRALTEAAQVRLTAIAGSRDDLSRRYYARVRETPWLELLRAGMGTRPGRDFGEVPTRKDASLEEALDWMLERLRGAGLNQVVVVDLTRPEFQIPVVRVVIPGLEGPSSMPISVPGARARHRLEGTRW
ncbi:YcaO-like family protein [Stigmatella sp. ncwal1]|uniref:YcaO-like family protein n=1 Tax=Stigmatella ashevillensis TaxID=2995309 RepID=A0ABT5DI32_9BACT|nr:YcaO-like family protein [Stigmatella ashevillena]MDC0713181.1 YcaO-like family protein [Stigmatella ashevillena]